MSSIIPSSPVCGKPNRAPRNTVDTDNSKCYNAGEEPGKLTREERIRRTEAELKNLRKQYYETTVKHRKAAIMDEISAVAKELVHLREDF